MRRAPRARVQIDSTTTPTTGGPPALPPRDALEEDGAARAHPLPIHMDMAPAGDAVADAGAADVAYDEAQVDDDDEEDDDELETTMPMGLHLTKSNTVSPDLYHRLQCIARARGARNAARTCLCSSCYCPQTLTRSHPVMCRQS